MLRDGSYWAKGKTLIDCGGDMHSDYVIQNPEKFGMKDYVDELFELMMVDEDYDIRAEDVYQKAFDKGWVRIGLGGPNSYIHGRKNKKTVDTAWDFCSEQQKNIPSDTKFVADLVPPGQVRARPFRATEDFTPQDIIKGKMYEYFFESRVGGVLRCFLEKACGE